MAIFYSRQNGNWEDGANWHRDDTTPDPVTGAHTGAAGTSPGVAGTDYPGTGDKAYISAGHTITVTTDLSGFATAVTLACDAPGTNNGTLKFSATATTGLKAVLGTINASSTFKIFMGERTAPIRRGNTCTLTSGGANFAMTTGTFQMETWGQHREHGSTDVYADIFTVAPTAGSTQITLNGDISPGLGNTDWLFLCERETSSSATIKAKAELVQLSNWNSGTRVATLTKPLKYSYTTTNGYAFKAKEKFVNSLLSADHTSGATYVLEEDLYPSGTAGGSFLVCRSNESVKSGTQYPTVSSYNSGTKTLTATASSSTSQSKGSLVLMDDFNVKVLGAAGALLGQSSGAGTVLPPLFAYTSFDTWESINSGPATSVMVHSNCFDVKSINNSTITGCRMIMYGTGAGQKAAAASEARGFLVGLNGHQLFRCRLMQSSDTSTNRILGGSSANSISHGYFEDCYFYAGRKILNGVNDCVFKDCTLGNITTSSNLAIVDSFNNQFNGCSFFGINGTSSSVFQSTISAADKTFINQFNNCSFGQTGNGKVITNTMNFDIQTVPINLLMNGATLASGEPDPSFSNLVANSGGTGIVRMAMFGGITNQFRNITPGGKAEHDTSGYRSSAPSIKFTHSNSEHPVWFDVPIYLGTGSKTITIYTNPSTGSWTEAPRLILMSEHQADLSAKFWQNINYIETSVQTTLTTSVYSQLQLTTIIATAGIYVLRLWSKNASGTLNWDDVSVS